MTPLLIFAMLILLFLVLLPFWYAIPKISDDKRLIQGVLHPGPRRYTLILPESGVPVDAVPLVIALHFGGHGLPFYGELFLTDLIEPSLRGLGAIIAAPDCPSKDWTQPESEQFVMKLVDHLRDQYSIDPRKILITGFSMGGIGTWHIASQYPQKFSAALVMAANPIEDAFEVEWDLPLYILHARDDELFPIVNTTQVVVGLEEQGVDITYRILENTTHYETHKFKAPLKETVPWVLERWN